MRLAVLGLSHKTAPVELRERFALKPEAVPAALRALVDSGAASEAVLLATCNRVELYAVVAQSEGPGLFAPLEEAMSRWSGLSCEAFSGGLYRLEGEAVVRHLFRVAAGLDSMVVGETEILGQAKEAYLAAVGAGKVGRLTNPLFQRAFRAAKEVHTRTRISRRPPSVGSVAVELAGRIFQDLPGRRALVVGAGQMAQRALEELVARGVSGVTVVNRDRQAGEALAGRFGGAWFPFARVEESLREADIVISSTAAPHPVLTRAMIERAIQRRRHRPLFVIDIAVPRDVEPLAAGLSDLFLYDIDDLEEVVSAQVRRRQEELDLSERIVRAHADAFLAAHLGDLARDPQGDWEALFSSEGDPNPRSP